METQNLSHYQKEILSRLKQETHTGKENPNCYELVLLRDEGETLCWKELKELNSMGFVYHSEQTDIEYENEDGTFSYMDIFYFVKVQDTKTLFIDCIPY